MHRSVSSYNGAETAETAPARLKAARLVITTSTGYFQVMNFAHAIGETGLVSF
jgi:hypothetical protein